MLKNPCTSALLLIVTCYAAGQALAQEQTVRQKTSADLQNAPHVEMQNVLFRYSPAISIHVIRLRGSLLPTQGNTAPSFNDPASFVVATDAAEVRMSTGQLAALMNDWLLSSPKAQVKHVQIQTAGDRLLIQGTMKKGVPVPFRAEAAVSVANDNRIRITVQKMKAARVPIKGLLDAFGVSLDDLVSQKGLKGMSVEGDSFLIDPQTAFPPPQIRAKLAQVKVSPGGLTILFGQGAPGISAPPAKNYIALRGGAIKYGREEMFDSDLIMIDTTPADPFEFYLKHYWCQMVAGSIRVTPEQALRINVPDFSKMRNGSCK